MNEKDINLTQVRDLVDRLNREVEQKLDDFTKQTGLQVTRMEIEHYTINRFSGKSEDTYQVRTKWSFK